MKDVIFIVADKTGALRMTKRAPVLKRAEVAVKLNLSIPDGCFLSPVISVALDVSEDRVIVPTATVEALEQPSDEAPQ